MADRPGKRTARGAGPGGGGGLVLFWQRERVWRLRLLAGPRRYGLERSGRPVRRGSEAVAAYSRRLMGKSVAQELWRCRTRRTRRTGKVRGAQVSWMQLLVGAPRTLVGRWYIAVASLVHRGKEAGREGGKMGWGGVRRGRGGGRGAARRGGFHGWRSRRGGRGGCCRYGARMP